MVHDRKMHWMAAKHMLRYLKGSCELKLTYRGTSNGIAMYSDADLTSQVVLGKFSLVWSWAIFAGLETGWPSP